MYVDVLAHGRLFGGILALQGIAADFERTAIPGVDCGFDAREGVGVSGYEFGAKELGCSSQYLRAGG